ncbi:MAG: DUF948 domain-containing protein [Nitrospirae bacterium]|nr:MAG: DUF948 domain-containing protein [Nitrospirota bacterium]
MNEIWFALVSLAFFVVGGFFIYTLIEVRKSAAALTELIKDMDGSLKPAIEELRDSMKSLKVLADDINAITEDVRLVSGSARDIGQNLKRVSELVNEVSSESLIKVSGLRVGIRTALEVLLKNIFLKGGNQ